jgi:hypothetical protein
MKDVYAAQLLDSFEYVENGELDDDDSAYQQQLPWAVSAHATGDGCDKLCAWKGRVHTRPTPHTDAALQQQIGNPGRS